MGQKGAPVVKVNGNIVNAGKDEQGFISLKRQWKNDDNIEVVFPMNLYVETMLDNKKQNCFVIWARYY